MAQISNESFSYAPGLPVNILLRVRYDLALTAPHVASSGSYRVRKEQITIARKKTISIRLTPTRSSRITYFQPLYEQTRFSISAKANETFIAMIDVDVIEGSTANLFAIVRNLQTYPQDQPDQVEAVIPFT